MNTSDAGLCIESQFDFKETKHKRLQSKCERNTTTIFQDTWYQLLGLF